MESLLRSGNRLVGRPGTWLLAALLGAGGTLQAAETPAGPADAGRPSQDETADWSRGMQKAKTLPLKGAVSVSAWGTRAAVVSQDNGKLTVTMLDVSTPAEPKTLASAEVGDGTLLEPGNETFQEGMICLRENLAFIAKGTPPELLIADVIGTPKVVGRFPLNGAGNSVVVDGRKRAYVMSWRAPFYILDVADPAAPKLLSKPRFSGGYGSDVCLDGDTAYVITWSDGTVHAMDVSNPAGPKELSSYKAYPGWGYRIAIRQKIAYIAADAYAKVVGGIHAVNVSDPAKFSAKQDKSGAAAGARLGFISATQYTTEVRQMTRDMAIAYPWLFVTDHRFGVVLMDVRDPKAMKIVDKIRMPSGAARGMASTGKGVVYLCDMKEGLTVLTPK